MRSSQVWRHSIIVVASRKSLWQRGHVMHGASASLLTSTTWCDIVLSNSLNFTEQLQPTLPYAVHADAIPLRIRGRIHVRFLSLPLSLSTATALNPLPKTTQLSYQLKTWDNGVWVRQGIGITRRFEMNCCFANKNLRIEDWLGDLGETGTWCQGWRGVVNDL